MHRKQVFRIILVILAIMALTLILGGSAWAAGQYKTIHRFNRQTGVRGFAPAGALIFDGAGNLYGTTEGGGAHGWGTVFELTPNGDGSWTERVLHSFRGGRDGTQPEAGLIFDAAGNLYGTTAMGGSRSACIRDGCGTVFKLTPNGDGSWTESVLHSFNGSDGANLYSGLIFDAAGNLYGTTRYGGAFGVGTVFELTPNGDGSWTESVLHSFSSNGSDGVQPYSGLIFDAAGNLYGTTVYGGVFVCAFSCGTVFRLAPNGDGSWTESVLHSFNGSDGGHPYSDLIFDAAGNLYGTTEHGGAFGAGTVFELTSNGDGSWTGSVLHAFNGSDGANSNSLIVDAAGNLYGTTTYGGVGVCSYTRCGTVFKLRPTLSGTWRYRLLHQFMDTPGAWPNAGLVLDQAGNLYGTTYGDVITTYGSVFKITP